MEGASNRRTSRSSWLERAATELPSGAKAKCTEYGEIGTGKESNSLCRARSQSLSIPSLLADARVRPSDESARPVNQPPCPRSVAVRLPVRMSQTDISVSPPTMSVCPSGGTIAFGIVASDLEHVNQALVSAGDGFLFRVSRTPILRLREGDSFSGELSSSLFLLEFGKAAFPFIRLFGSIVHLVQVHEALKRHDYPRAGTSRNVFFALLHPGISREQQRFRLKVLFHIHQQATEIAAGEECVPVIRGLACTDGERFAKPGFGLREPALRLPHAVAPLFEDCLARHLPEKKEKVLNRVRALRRGKLNNAEFGLRMRGEGIFADQISQMFQVACRRAGGLDREPELSTAFFRRPGVAQLELALAAGSAAKG